MNDILDYIFNNMKKLDNRQDRIIRALNRCRISTNLSCNISLVLCLYSIWKELGHNAEISILNRKIEDLEKRLNEYADDHEEV